MIARIASAAAGLLLATTAFTAPAFAKTYYWISHGSPADPVWTYFLAGAEQWAMDTGNTVNTSFHNGDVAAHQEAVRAAISANARTPPSSPSSRSPATSSSAASRSAAPASSAASTNR